MRPLSLSAGIPLRASAYDAADLCADIERFSFLLGGNGGEPQRNWAAPGSLPDETLDYIGPAIANFSQGRHFCELGWEPAFP